MGEIPQYLAVVEGQQFIWLPGRLPGFNELAGAALLPRNGGRAYAGLKRDVEQRIGVLLKSERVKPVMKPSYFTYLFVEGDRRRDPSNVSAGGIKVIEDALQACGRVHGPKRKVLKRGLLAGDGWAHVLGIASYVVTGEEPGCFVAICPDTTLTKTEMVEWMGKHRKAKP